MLYVADVVERITYGREQYINSLVESVSVFILRINTLLHRWAWRKHAGL